MGKGVVTIIYPVRDLLQATRLYAALTGAGPTVNEGDYVGFSAGGVDVGLDAGGHVAGMTGPMSFWNVPDVLERLAELLDAGWSMDTPVRKAGGGRMIATVRDPDGNVVGLMQPGPGA